jgi:uncharacterized membrane protein YhaH (DUF805 family)
MMQNLSPIGWALRPLKNYANFSGRASRAEFWWFFLFMFVLYFVVWIALVATIGLSAASGSPPSLGVLGAFGIAGIFMLLFWLATIIPTIAVQVRRLHDIDRSGWWIGGFYLAYIAYVVIMFSLIASFQVTPNGAPPDMSATSPLSLISYLGFGFFVYGITLLVFFCLEGTKGPNRFGDDPYGPDVEQVFA